MEKKVYQFKNRKMTRVISISNQKGGVGKTTSTLNIGAALAIAGKKTLLIDMDPQCNLSKSLGAEKCENDIYGLLIEDCSIRSAVFKIRKNLLLIPGSKNFPVFEKNYGSDINSFFLLRDKLESLLENSIVDYVLIDCPPSLGLISTNAYLASDNVIVPLEAMEFSLDGLDLVNESVERLSKKLNPDLRLLGAFFTRYDHRLLVTKETESIVHKEYPGLLLESNIRQCTKLRESPSNREDIFSYAPESNGAQDYNLLANKLDVICQGISI
ncbi:ParA family protein [Fulvivirga lutea]|uniref:ParA family protein n=1 Tax=Fulvivirga lutea TaxID=2810512 RepID=A0A974WJY4_9BACT|nr:AAA family ATPase [Fulvivirga lutea]QSE99188.1 ParA family protein [Fulvivirga lutea]